MGCCLRRVLLSIPIISLVFLSLLAPVASADGLSPLSASGCNGDVCLSVTGNGTSVSAWSTSVEPSSAICTHAEFLVNNSLVGQSATKCLASSQSASASLNNPSGLSLSPGDQLCNEWAGVPGKPCATIE
jgi:hypothetical protein